MDVSPKIRPGIEAIPVNHEGREILVLRDRTNVSEDLAVERQSADILLLLDGSTSLRDIQVSLMRKHGLGLIGIDEIQNLVERLDEHFMLDNERYRNHLRVLAERFRKESIRPASHAGQAYPEDPAALSELLAGYFDQPGGPGFQGSVQQDKTLCGLVLPHIDFQRGGHCYAWGFSALPQRTETELYMILGTCHLPMTQPFALTTKAFQTPLGRVSCAGDLAESIAQRAGVDLFHDELLHRSEHTIEFQVVFLQYLLGDEGDYQILPILCSGFQEMLEKRILPMDHDPYRRALEAIIETLNDSTKQTCLIASADLAHLGPQFGDPYPVQQTALKRVEQDDKGLLQFVLDGDAEGFYRTILGEGDRRRICGLPPIYTLLSVSRSDDIRLLNYGQAFHPHATVTFASLALWN